MMDSTSDISINTTLQDHVSCECDPNCPLTVTTSFWLEGCILATIGMFGLVGNMIAIIVLTRPQMKSNFNYLLVTLSVVDSLFVATGIWDYSLVKVFKYKPQVYIYLFPYFWHPLKSILMSWTTFLIMGITAERYLAVCRPIVYRNMEKTYRTVVRVVSVTAPAFFLAFLLNCPTFFEARLVNVNATDDNNITMTWTIYNVTELRVNQNYTYYYIHWTRLLMTGVLPFTFLAFMNAKIYYKIRQNNKSQVRSRSSQTKKASNLAIILIVVVLVFLVSNIPRLALNLYDFALRQNENCDPVWFTCLASFSHLLLITSSSINFLIYCSMGEKFKNTVYHFLNRMKGSSPTTQKDTSNNGHLTEEEDDLELEDEQHQMEILL